MLIILINIVDIYVDKLISLLMVLIITALSVDKIKSIIRIRD